MGMMHNKAKWHRSKQSKRLQRKRARNFKRRANLCNHKRAHVIHSGDIYCPSCKIVVGYDREDRPEKRPERKQNVEEEDRTQGWSRASFKEAQGEAADTEAEDGDGGSVRPDGEEED